MIGEPHEVPFLCSGDQIKQPITIEIAHADVQMRLPTEGLPTLSAQHICITDPRRRRWATFLDCRFGAPVDRVVRHGVLNLCVNESNRTARVIHFAVEQPSASLALYCRPTPGLRGRGASDVVREVLRHRVILKPAGPIEFAPRVFKRWKSFGLTGLRVILLHLESREVDKASLLLFAHQRSEIDLELGRAFIECAIAKNGRIDRHEHTTGSIT